MVITNPLYKSRANELLDFCLMNKNDNELLSFFFERKKYIGHISDYRLDGDCCLVWFKEVPYGFVLNIKYNIVGRID
jgi:hypothetical protein